MAKGKEPDFKSSSLFLTNFFKISFQLKFSFDINFYSFRD